MTLVTACIPLLSIRCFVLHEFLAEYLKNMTLFMTPATFDSLAVGMLHINVWHLHVIGAIYFNLSVPPQEMILKGFLLAATISTRCSSSRSSK